MIVSRTMFEAAMNVVWSEIEYQNNLERRTDNEAKDVAGFLTLGRRYLRLAENDWADNAGPDKAIHQLRKLAAIFVRAMVYCGMLKRSKP